MAHGRLPRIRWAALLSGCAAALNIGSWLWEHGAGKLDWLTFLRMVDGVGLFLVVCLSLLVAYTVIVLAVKLLTEMRD